MLLASSRCCWVAMLLGSRMLLGLVQGERVAIVGAGIGGASSAYWLRGGNEIVVFEANDRVGGRLEHFNYGNGTYELGAAIVVSGNRYVLELAEAMNLTVQKPPHVGGKFGLSSGDRFVYRESLVGALWRYGPRTLTRARNDVIHFFDKFNQIYALLENGDSFETPEKLWQALDLWNATFLSFEAHLTSKLPKTKGAQRFIRELAYAVNRVNYNQGNDINALTGSVSLCPAFSGQDILALKGGNAQLVDRLLTTSNADLRLNHKVLEVQEQDDQVLVNVKGRNETFDVVIIAAPLATADILKLKDDREYQTTHTTFVAGRCRRLGVLSSMFVVENSTDIVSSISTHVHPSRRHNNAVYKVFSREELSDADLATLFDPGFTVLHRRPWPAAYPKLRPFTPDSKLPPFQLSSRVYYVNTLEAATSALEISAIAARNVVNLIRRGNQCSL